VAADVTAQAIRGLLGAALAALPAGGRDVLRLIAWEQLTYREVSRALAIPGGDGAIQAQPGAHQGPPGPDRYRCGSNV
jgi:DNA-directed RNA polymerase specialized sigma24 family protein